MDTLTKEQLALLKSIKDGATIFGLPEAKMIRDIQKINPELIEIVQGNDLQEILGSEKAMYDERGRLAYFGAILTKKGRELLNIKEIDTNDEIELSN